MYNPASTRLFAWLLSVGLLFPVLCLAATQQATGQSLQQIRRDISTIKSNLHGDKQQQKKYQQELRSLEQKIANLSQQQRQTQHALTKQQHKQQQLNDKADTLHQTLERQRRDLKQQARAAYSSGQQQTLKMLLNQTDPGLAGRNLIYYSYFTRAQLETINQTKSSLQELSDTEAELESSNTQLKKLQSEYSDQKTELLQRKQDRTQLLSKLNNDIQDKESTLSRLLENEKALSKLLQDLTPTKPDTHLNFANLGKLKGKLKLPTQGKIKHHYGSTRTQGRLKWQGITISGKEGQDIKAIAPGQVVFADWIRGYGLLLIIDHSQGYMSLYGHNQSLYKDVGDHVSANELIATLGNSGGSPDPGLYFEMRHQGKPVNPETWCR